MRPGGLEPPTAGPKPAVISISPQAHGRIIHSLMYFGNSFKYMDIYRFIVNGKEANAVRLLEILFEFVIFMQVCKCGYSLVV